MKHFAEFYDAISDPKDAKRRSQTVMQRVRKHHPDATSVLELGVGNGRVLENIPERFEKWGLDIERRYIALAKQRNPDARCIVSSMHQFSLEKRFDVIYCVFDSLNFLKSWEEWRQTFTRVRHHLVPGGVFIFDVYTPRMLDATKGKGASLWKESFGFASDEGIVRGNKLTWVFRLFERIGKNHYALHTAEFHERIFPVSKIESLFKGFSVVEKVDYETGRKPTRATMRLLYTLRKKH